MRLNPFDDDTLFQVAYTVTAPVDNHPIGPRHAATFARHWLEACDMVRKKYGLDLADRVRIERVFVYDRDTGVKRETDYFPARARSKAA